MSLYSFVGKEEFKDKQIQPIYSGLELLWEEVLLKERWE
jgi:hypothetical protein